MTQVAALDGPHWAYALRVYAQEGVSPACLYLQDNHGVDVNVLLLCLYATSRLRLPISQPEIALMAREAAEMRTVIVEPLRAIRRYLKPQPFGPAGEALRGLVKSAELASEQLEQARLAAILDTMAGKKGEAGRPETICHAVVRHYAAKAGSVEALPADDLARQAIRTIASAA